MIERFRQLALREQIVLGGGAALAFLIIGWSFVWTPLADTVAELRDSVEDRSRLMVDLQRAAALPSSGAAAAAGAGSQELMALVDATARPLGLNSSFQSQRYDADGTFRVAFQNAPFAQLIDWLIALDREHGVRADTVLNLVHATRGPGLVSGQLVLSGS